VLRSRDRETQTAGHAAAKMGQRGANLIEAGQGAASGNHNVVNSLGQFAAGAGEAECLADQSFEASALVGATVFTFAHREAQTGFGAMIGMTVDDQNRVGAGLAMLKHRGKLSSSAQAMRLAEDRTAVVGGSQGGGTRRGRRVAHCWLSMSLLGERRSGLRVG